MAGFFSDFRATIGGLGSYAAANAAFRSKEIVVRGIVSPAPLWYALGNTGDGGGPDQVEQRMATSFELGYDQRARVLWAVRVDLAGNPYLHAVIPWDLQPEMRVIPGDEVVIKIRPERVTRGPLPNWVVDDNGWGVPMPFRTRLARDEERHWAIGEVTEFVSINGQAAERVPPNDQRQIWELTDLSHLGSDFGTAGPPLAGSGPLFRILRLLGGLPYEGDYGIFVGEPKSGKSWQLRHGLVSKGLVTGLDPRYDVVSVLVGEHSPDVAPMARVMAARENSEFFFAPNTTSRIRVMPILEIAAHRAMIRAAQGRNVVLVIDSLTGGIADPLNQRGAPEGVGTLSGGVNPMSLAALKVILGTAGRRPGMGTITTIGTILVRTGDDMPFVNTGKSTARFAATFSPDARAALVDPPIDPGPDQSVIKGVRVVTDRVFSRSQEDATPPELVELQARLRAWVGERPPRPNSRTPDYQAPLQVDRLRRLIAAMERHPDDDLAVYAEVLGRKAVPGWRPEPERVRPAVVEELLEQAQFVFGGVPQDTSQMLDRLAALKLPSGAEATRAELRAVRDLLLDRQRGSPAVNWPTPREPDLLDRLLQRKQTAAPSGAS